MFSYPKFPCKLWDLWDEKIAIMPYGAKLDQKNADQSVSRPQLVTLGEKFGCFFCDKN